MLPGVIAGFRLPEKPCREAVVESCKLGLQSIIFQIDTLQKADTDPAQRQIALSREFHAI